MKEMTYSALCEAFWAHNKENNITSQFADKKPLIGRIVFKQGPWFRREFTEVERTYDFTSDNKAFIGGMGGNSIFGSALDGTEKGVRLDWLMKEQGWQVEKCFILEDGDK